MTQNELLYILTIAEHGNITRAAQELFISQPSLSESLNKVEQEFGTTIFDRTQDGLVPTDFGLRYLDTARKILDRFKRLETELDEYRQMRRGKLTFGIPINLGTYLLPRVLPAFQELYPDISVQFKENNSTELDKLMLSGKLDFSVMHYETPNEAIHYELLAEDDFYLVMPLALTRKYHFPDYRPLNVYDLKALEKEPFLMVANRQKLRQVADSILSQLSIKPKHPLHHQKHGDCQAPGRLWHGCDLSSTLILKSLFRCRQPGLLPPRPGTAGIVEAGHRLSQRPSALQMLKRIYPLPEIIRRCSRRCQ